MVNINRKEYIMTNETDTRLQSLIERIERLNEEKDGILADIRDVFAEAKSAGYDIKAMREVIKLRKKTEAEREEDDYMLEAYRKALGC